MADTDLRVLVVDDERSIRRFLKASLGSQFVVLEATNGEEALTAAATEHPDIIILDLGLPDMDGVEVTRRLREWTQIPIIIVSVREQETDKIAALDAGADDYLTIRRRGIDGPPAGGLAALRPDRSGTGLPDRPFGGGFESARGQGK